ncbi:hypothetical protein [Cognatiluteimonas profundi]|uniref:hypothetical protein n=1 Tax=Cognatiluteimonas profundi TaxID=2594501 RepID=UPI00131CDE7B|nr:hypothetical protein [Lysobacter profundi]
MSEPVDSGATREAGLLRSQPGMDTEEDVGTDAANARVRATHGAACTVATDLPHYGILPAATIRNASLQAHARIAVALSIVGAP